MTKNKLNTGDLWFNPNEPEKLAVFKKNKWETFTPELSDKQKDILQIANYRQQLAELETQFWFNDLPTKEYMVRFDGIKKRIHELENKHRTALEKFIYFVKKLNKLDNSMLFIDQIILLPINI